MIVAARFLCFGKFVFLLVKVDFDCCCVSSNMEFTQQIECFEGFNQSLFSDPVPFEDLIVSHDAFAVFTFFFTRL